MSSKRKGYQTVQWLLVFSLLIAFGFPLQAKGAAELSLEKEEQIEESAAQLEILMEAAKLLVKFAVGTNAVALAGTLIYYGGKCTYLHG